MPLYNLNKATVIYPWEKEEVNSLVRKWKISISQLNEAIVETGSINRRVIRRYLEQKGLILSLRRMIKYLKLRYLN